MMGGSKHAAGSPPATTITPITTGSPTDTPAANQPTTMQPKVADNASPSADLASSPTTVPVAVVEPPTNDTVVAEGPPSTAKTSAAQPTGQIDQEALTAPNSVPTPTVVPQASSETPAAPNLDNSVVAPKDKSPVSIPPRA